MLRPTALEIRMGQDMPGETARQRPMPAHGVRVGEGSNLIINNGNINVASKATANTDSFADAGMSSTGTAVSTSRRCRMLSAFEQVAGKMKF